MYSYFSLPTRIVLSILVLGIVFTLSFILFSLDETSSKQETIVYPVIAALLIGGSICLVLFAEQIDSRYLFIENLTAHRDRIINSNHPESDFVSDQINERVIKQLAIYAYKDMRKTLKDREPRSTTITLDKICFMVHTIQCTAEYGKTVFSVKWGGYIEAMNEFMASKEVASSTAEVFCHITFGQYGGDSWVNASLVPLNSNRFKEVPIVAMDLIVDS